MNALETKREMTSNQAISTELLLVFVYLLDADTALYVAGIYKTCHS